VACVVAYLASFCARAGCGTTDLRFSEESLNEIFSQTSRYIMWEDSEDLGSGRNFLGYVVVLPSALSLHFLRLRFYISLGSDAAFA